MLRTDFCNRLAYTCTRTDRSRPEPTDGACAPAATRVMRRLTTPRELWSKSFTRRSPRRRTTGAARSCGTSIGGPSGCAPGYAVLSSAAQESSTSADAFTTTRSRRSARPPLNSPYPSSSSKVEARARPGAFHRRMPARAGPPPAEGFATLGAASDALSLPRPVSGERS